MAILDLNAFSAYSLTMKGLVDYYNAQEINESTDNDHDKIPFGAFPQNYAYKKKNGGHYKKTAYPNAWLDQNHSYINISAAAGDSASELSVKDLFEIKDEQGLTYLWQWIKTSGEQGPHNSAEGNYGDYDAKVYKPKFYDSKVTDYKYGSHMKQFILKAYEPASLTTTGLRDIDISKLDAFGIDDNGEITGEEPTVNWEKHSTYIDDYVDPNWRPTETPSARTPYGSAYQTSMTKTIFGNEKIRFNVGGSMTSGTTFSQTNGTVDTKNKTNQLMNSWKIEGGWVPPEHSGGKWITVGYQGALTQTTENISEVNFSETTSYAEGVEIESGFTVTVDPGIGMDFALTAGDGNFSTSSEEYIINIGDEVTISVQASRGEHNYNFAVPWIYKGSVSEVKLGSNTPNNSARLLPNTNSKGGHVRHEYTAAKPRVMSDQIGKIGQYSLDYDYFDVVMSSPSSSSLIEVQDNNLKVNGYTNADTVVAFDYQVITQINPSNSSNSQLSDEKQETNISEQIEQGFSSKNVETKLNHNVLNKSIQSILDLNQIRTDRVSAALAEDKPHNFPGYNVTSEHDSQDQLIILSSEYDSVDFGESKNDHVVIGVGKRDRIQLGLGDDIVDLSESDGFSSAYTAEGDDIVYGGEGDFINTNSGNDHIITLGRSFVDSGSGSDDHAIRKGAMATLINFVPGDDIIQHYKTSGQQNIRSGTNFVLSEISSSGGRTYSVANKKGDESAILSLHRDHLMNNNDAKLNLALRQKGGFLKKNHLRHFRETGYFKSSVLEEAGDIAKKRFEKSGFADRDLYFNHNSKADIKKFFSQMRDVFTQSFDRDDVMGVLSTVKSNNDWNSNYPWLDVFNTSLGVLSDL